jgi:hypothetical protein
VAKKTAPVINSLPGTIDALQFLMTREITHMKAFTAALESLGKPAFSIGRIPPTPGLVDQYTEPLLLVSFRQSEIKMEEAVVVNDHLVFSKEDVDHLKKTLRQLVVQFVFVQAKTSGRGQRSKSPASMLPPARRLRQPGNTGNAEVQYATLDRVRLISGGTPKTDEPDYWNGRREAEFYTGPANNGDVKDEVASALRFPCHGRLRRLPLRPHAGIQPGFAR